MTTNAAGLQLAAEASSTHFVLTASDWSLPNSARVTVDWAELPEQTEGELLFDTGTGSMWRMYRQQNNYLIRIGSPFYGPRPYKLARFAADFATGTVYLNREHFTPGTYVYPLRFPLDELLVTNLLAQGHGVELHSCGLIDADGKGYLFIGQSGAGKSTTARLWLQHAGVKVLSDDRIILRLHEGRIWMYGTPWHGEAELSLAGKIPLDHIFFLKQAPANELTPLRPIEAVARFTACGFPTFYRPDCIHFTLGFYEEITKHVPCHELSFLPNQHAVELVRQFAG